MKVNSSNYNRKKMLEFRECSTLIKRLREGFVVIQKCDIRMSTWSMPSVRETSEQFLFTEHLTRRGSWTLAGKLNRVRESTSETATLIQTNRPRDQLNWVSTRLDNGIPSRHQCKLTRKSRGEANNLQTERTETKAGKNSPPPHHTHGINGKTIEMSHSF